MPADPYKYFRVEAREIVEQLGQGVLDLEKGERSAEGVRQWLRLAHTLKGAAGVVKQREIAELAHRLEDLLTAIHASPAADARGQIERALGLLDQISARLAALAPPTGEVASAPRGLPVEESRQVFRPDLEAVEAFAARLSEVQSEVSRLRPEPGDTDRIRQLIGLVDDQATRMRSRDGDGSPARAGSDVALSLTEELRERFRTFERNLIQGIERVERELGQASDAGEQLRLVQASTVFHFLERAARDAAEALGKQVAFSGRGGNIRVDSGVLSTLQSALLQIVRNAVAHGIEEGQQERLDAGKPPVGQITVTVSHHGNEVRFTCEDDGRGVDVEAIRSHLRGKGMTVPADDSLDSDALLSLLLTSGISTSPTVTGIAGRGIGLDVVREVSQRLGGRVSLRTAAGRGTTFALVVPFSSASMRALTVHAAGVRAAVPLAAVPRTLRIHPDQLVNAPQGPAVLVDGRALPVVPLARLLGRSHADVQSRVASPAFVVEGSTGAVAIVVDRIIGTGSIVTRRLPEYAPAARSVVGASLDAGGQPHLVLDPVHLIAEAQGLDRLEPSIAPTKPVVLVVDDSLTTRMLEQSILESAGYTVDLAASAEEGLQRARTGRYALFLVDVEMPGMDGFSFVEHVRADPQLRHIPAILVTSRAAADDQRRGREAGAQGYIVKGEFDQRALLEQIRSLL